MIKISKHTVIEILLIVVLATALAVLYNFIRTERLPFFPKSKEELLVDDGELFGTISDSTIAIEVPPVLPTDTATTDTPLDSIAQVPDTASTIDSVKTKPDTAVAEDFEALLQNAKKSSFGEYPIVSYQQMKKIASDRTEKFLIIDARRAEPYSERHIGNAINICPYEPPDIVMQKIAELPPNKIIIVYCDGGNCDSSHEIATLLKAMGIERFYIYEGGWEEWSKK